MTIAIHNTNGSFFWGRLSTFGGGATQHQFGRGRQRKVVALSVRVWRLSRSLVEEGSTSLVVE